MSSPNHLACSWASEWHPTLISRAGERRPAFLLATTDAIRQAQGDHALAQYVLHRLAKTKVDPEG